MSQKDEENPVSEDEAQAEKQKLRPNPSIDMEMRTIPIKMKDGHPEVIEGHDDPIIQTHHLRYLLIGFNGFVARTCQSTYLNFVLIEAFLRELELGETDKPKVLGIAMLAVSVWLRVDPEFWEYETTLDVDNFYTVCAMLIVASIVLLLVGFLGCMGSISEQRWMLILYMTLFGLIFIIELAAIVIMWYAPYSSKISSELEKQLRIQIEEREHDDSSRYFMDFIQEHLYCCGSTGVRDYAAMSAPNSCLDERTGEVYTYGCATKMLTYLRSKAGIVGGIALPILFVQLLAIVAAGCLIKRLQVDSSYFTGIRS